MTVAELRLYSYGIDRTRGDVPIFATAAAEAAAGSGTGVTAPSLTFTSVKVRRDPYPQNVEISISESSMSTLELCDVAVMKIGSVDRWYWITGYQEITNSAYPSSTSNRMNVMIGLEYIPVTTGLTLASKIDILPERKPSATPRVMQNWTQSVMIPASPAYPLPSLNKLPKIKHCGVSTQILWTEITYKSTSGLVRMGFFVGADLYTSTTETWDEPLNIRFAGQSEGKNQIYPSLYDITQGDLMTELNVNSTMADIVDINISEFCPYVYTTGSIDSSFDYIKIIRNNNTDVPSTKNTYSGAIYGYYSDFDGAPCNTSNQYNKKLNKTTITLTPTAFERQNGRYIIRDSLKNNIMIIPGDMMKASMTIDCYTYSDNSGIYAFFKYENISAIIPSNKMPWTTSQWEQYRAYSMQYDRQALQNNIDMINKEMNIGVIDSAVNGVVGGAIGGALTGGPVGVGIGTATGVSSLIGGTITANMRREKDIDKLQRDQQLTEMRMRNQPGTANNTSYGIGYINRIVEYDGAEIILEMPADFTETEFNSQTALWGYPSNKVKQSSVAITAGYWKGRVTAFTDTINNTSAGELSNLMVQQFDNGLRLKQVS